MGLKNFKLKNYIVLGIGSIIVFLAPLFNASAYEKQSINFDTNKTFEEGTQLGAYDDIANTGPVVTVSLMINLLLQLLGVFSLALVFYGGFLWMTAQGDQEKITKAKGILVGSVMGLFIILASYSISQAIFRQFVTITN